MAVDPGKRQNFWILLYRMRGDAGSLIGLRRSSRGNTLYWPARKMQMAACSLISMTRITARTSSIILFQSKYLYSERLIENFRIRVFRTVARHLNFSRAAEELFLTQPAVTQQIKALEDELRVPLFDRAGGHISLTPAGKALLPLAEKMKALSDEALAAVAGAYGQHAGELSLGASQTIGQ